MCGINMVVILTKVTKRKVVLSLLMLPVALMWPLKNPAADEMWLGDWLQINNPRVKKYLTNLGLDDIGKEGVGVELSDGTIVLSHYRFLGSPAGIGRGVHMYLFSYQQRNYAYTWVDPTGEKLMLPDCSISDPKIIGKGTYVLSGDVYTWKYVRPGDGVVYNVCPKPSWLAAARVRNSPGP